MADYTVLLNALQCIAALDPATTDSGFNEWGEAECFRQAVEIAARALEAYNNGN